MGDLKVQSMIWNKVKFCIFNTAQNRVLIGTYKITESVSKRSLKKTIIMCGEWEAGLWELREQEVMGSGEKPQEVKSATLHM